MPNWCMNTTNVYGLTDNVKAFEEAIKDRGDGGFIRHLYPIPEVLANTPATFVDLENPVHPNWVNFVADGTWTQEEYDQRAAEAIASAQVYKDNIENYGYKDWYDWAISNWGTKWGDHELIVSEMYLNDEYTSTLGLEYETAWGPALDALNHISTMFPKLIFYTFYREEGMGFAGYYKVCNGEVMMDTSAEFIPNESDYDHILMMEDEREIERMVK